MYWHKAAGRWRAEIKHEGRKKHLGYFDVERVAAEAYVAAARLRLRALLSMEDGTQELTVPV